MKSIVVQVMPEETRMAVLEEKELAEIVVERDDSEHIVGNIYQGKVQNVLPGMQAAFVDIGQEKNAFLYIGDSMPGEAVKAMNEQQVFHIGQSCMIQIVKDAVGTKGPRATTHLTLPGRYVVLMPTADYVGLSRRIESAEERSRLKNTAEKICPDGMGLIVRTVAEGQSEETLQKDVDYLVNLWHSVKARNKVSAPPTLLFRDADLAIRIVRDYFNTDIDELVVNDADVCSRIIDLLKNMPELQSRVRVHQGSGDVFRAFGIEDELNKLGQREVELKSGGFLVIDKTEALTVIDVNTGKFIGQTNLADTVFQTNLEAAAAIARQIRLRDIGGIIIVDFIDMETAEQKKAVMDLLTDKVKQDKTKTNVVDLTPLGLVEMTRKKTRRNFEGTIYDKCPYCDGSGRLRSPETVAIAICRDLRRIAKKHRAANGYLIQLHPMVKDMFIKQGFSNKLQKELACRLVLEENPAMHLEVYTILQNPE